MLPSLNSRVPAVLADATIKGHVYLLTSEAFSMHMICETIPPGYMVIVLDHKKLPREMESVGEGQRFVIGEVEGIPPWELSEALQILLDKGCRVCLPSWFREETGWKLPAGAK